MAKVREVQEYWVSRDGALPRRRFTIAYSGAVEVDKSKQESRGVAGGLRRSLQDTFLPRGYPESVRPEYLDYQYWDSAQGLCSYLRGIIAAKAM
mmetsp:Transcript_3106/g.8822  ORF Transcript_3106/g.8822 Transcript_3106/m.8822 type:complete len:94 (-) Transcript_3106:38-319(-)